MRAFLKLIWMWTISNENWRTNKLNTNCWCKENLKSNTRRKWIQFILRGILKFYYYKWRLCKFNLLTNNPQLKVMRFCSCCSLFSVRLCVIAQISLEWTEAWMQYERSQQSIALKPFYVHSSAPNAFKRIMSILVSWKRRTARFDCSQHILTHGRAHTRIHEHA